MINLDKTTTEWNLSEEQMVYVKGNTNYNKFLVRDKLKELGAKGSIDFDFDNADILYYLHPETLEITFSSRKSSSYSFVKKFFHEIEIEEEPKFKKGDFIESNDGIVGIYDSIGPDGMHRFIAAYVGGEVEVVTNYVTENICNYKLTSTCYASDLLSKLRDEGMYYVPSGKYIDCVDHMPLDDTRYYYLDYELNDRRVKVLTVHTATFNRGQLYSIHRFINNNIFLNEDKAKLAAGYMNAQAEMAWEDMSDYLLENYSD